MKETTRQTRSFHLSVLLGPWCVHEDDYTLATERNRPHPHPVHPPITPVTPWLSSPTFQNLYYTARPVLPGRRQGRTTRHDTPRAVNKLSSCSSSIAAQGTCVQCAHSNLLSLFCLQHSFLLFKQHNSNNTAPRSAHPQPQLTQGTLKLAALQSSLG